MEEESKYETKESVTPKADPTEAEILERQAKVAKFYTSQAEFLEAQKQHLALLLEIDTINFKRQQIKVAVANLMAPPIKEEQTPENNDESKSNDK